MTVGDRPGAVTFSVLGPLEVRRGGAVVPLGPPKQRLLLAVLLCRLRQPLPADYLVETLWHGSPPGSARHNLRTYVHGLRRAVGADLLVRHGPEGYVLLADPGQVDHCRFHDVSVQGRAALAAGDVRRASDLIAQALHLWRGEAYPGLDDVPVLAAERARLEACRLACLEDRVDADLELGRHAEVVPELTALIDAHPYRERPHAQLMTALCRDGRRAEALAVYRRLRKRLATDLGIDPQPEVSGLHTAILDGRGAGEPRGEGPAPPVPAQLPPDAPVFTGRAAQLDRMTELLGERGAAGQALVIAAIGGVGGIGKTWLAVHWAHRHLDRFPDGQLFVNLRGFDPDHEPTPAPVAVRGFLHALGVPASAVPPGADAQTGLYRSLMASRRMLIVLDNARDSDQVADLLPGSGRSTVLITSRHRLTGLVAGRGARPLVLSVLDRGEARDLLARRLGAAVVEADRASVETVIDACAGLPLALAIAAARAALQPDLPLSVVAAELREEATRLGALDEEDPQSSLTAVLSWSYLALSPADRRVFRLLGLMPAPDIATTGAAALAGLPRDEVAEALRRLEHRSLMTQHRPDRWRLHDLVRLYAASEARRSPAEVDAALRRLADHDNHVAYAADRLLNPHRPALRLAEPVAGALIDPPAGPAAALAWFEDQHAELMAVQRLALDRKWCEPAWQLARSLDTFHWRRGLEHDRVAMWRAGLEAATAGGDVVAEARAHRLYGDACVRVERRDEGLTHLERALDLGRRLGDDNDVVQTLRALGYARGRGGDHRGALEHAREALTLIRRGGDTAAEADALNVVGWYTMLTGDLDAAVAPLRAALDLATERDQWDARAATLDSLGTLAFRAGKYREALSAYESALSTLRDLGDDFFIASTWRQIGDTEAALGCGERARHAWQRALALFEQQGRTGEAAELRERTDAG